MDPEFGRILFRVALVGGAILAIAAGTLVIAFRAFSPAQSRGRDFRPTILVAAVLIFVFVMCVILFRMSVVR